MSSLKLIDASPKGTVTYTLLIDPSYANLNGVMHGGAAGVIFDMATTTALGPIARKGYWDFMGGVTRTLNFSYLRAVPVGKFAGNFPFRPSSLFIPHEGCKLGGVDREVGTTVKLHSEVMQVGRTMAMIKGVMTSLDGKIVYVTCEHHKVAVPTQPHHLEFRVSWDDLWDKEFVEPRRSELEKEVGKEKAKL